MGDTSSSTIRREGQGLRTLNLAMLRLTAVIYAAHAAVIGRLSKTLGRRPNR
jgi:hypothetical protein